MSSRGEKEMQCICTVHHPTAPPKLNLKQDHYGLITTLIERTEPATTTTVVVDDVPWQPNGVVREYWSEEEVTTLKLAMSK